MSDKTIFRNLLAAAVAALAIAGTTRADTIDNFIASSDQFGYRGAVQNATLDTPPVSVPTPRDGYLYFSNNVPAGLGNVGNNNTIASNWNESPGSNQPAGFFQVGEGPASLPSVTSATGGWTQEPGGLWDFTLAVSGANATWDSSNSRLWRSDIGDGPGGTFSSYTYSMTATGMNVELENGWLTNTTNPTAITGTFTGAFVPTITQPGNDPILNGNTYTAALTFSNAYWDGADFSGTPSSTFAAPVPEPATLALLGSALLGLGVVYLRRRRRAKA